MKLTRKKIIYTILEALFYGIAPLVFVFYQYGSIGHTAEAVSFKISFTGILLALLVLMILKRTMLRRWIDNLTSQIKQHMSDLKIETDSGKAKNLIRELKAARTVETLFNAIMPIVLLVGLYVVCKALEQAVIKLSGVVGFIIISFIIGTVFSVLNAREVVSKNVKDNTR